MIKIFYIFRIFLIFSLISSCAQILQTVDLKIDTPDESIQDQFNVVEKTLTIQEAQEQNKSSYKRFVLQNGSGDKARTINENLVLQSNFPDESKPFDYRIGIGDTLTISRLIQNNHSKVENYNKRPENLPSVNYTLGVGDKLALSLFFIREQSTLMKITPENRDDPEEDEQFIFEKQNINLQTSSRIGSDGTILLAEVGRLKAKGKTLKNLQSEVRNILIRNGRTPRFQLEIVEFNSQKAYLTINSSSRVIILNDQEATLRDILIAAAVGFTPGITTQIRLQRNGKEYLMSLRDVFNQHEANLNIYNGDHIFVEDSSNNIVTSVSTVGHDGNLVLSGIGKIKAKNRTLSDLRAEISSLIEKIPGSINTFQIQITNFASQSALVTVPGQTGGVIPITDMPIALEEVLTESGLSADSNSVIRIRLNRRGKTYIFTLDDLLNYENGKVYLQPNDKIKTETLVYKENKVFILGGVNPEIFKINPANRETLADILFTRDGVLSSNSAKRSEVYLLRGNDPVVAYHLDAQSPTRLIVADAMELRPNDILYVAEQPIVSFNRTVATIIPLRLLLRDIQDDNIP